FPAHAGMSRAVRVGGLLADCFPRSRGDEPLDGVHPYATESFSPLTRG
ncbi:hypothetical protein HMPREF1978_01875, partial [Actinomyces graevenitzii F0530]